MSFMRFHSEFGLIMASIRKKTYCKKNGTIVEKFELTYSNPHGRRTTKLFNTKREADAARVRIEGEIANRTYVSSHNSITVIEGMRAWLEYMQKLADNKKHERSTVAKYKSHVECHIAKSNLAPLILSDIVPPDMQEFIEHLETNLTTIMSQKVFLTLKMGMKYCRRKHWLTVLPTEDFKIDNRDREFDTKVEVPPKEEIQALFAAADQDVTGFDGAVIRILCLCGLRPSELRGLRRCDILTDTTPAKIKISQRADAYNVIGSPKSRADYRTIPIGPDTLHYLKKAMLSRKAGMSNLVFPNIDTYTWSYNHFVHHWWRRLMLKAGLASTRTVRYKSDPHHDRTVIEPKFNPYTLRHIAASRWIEMGLMPKRIQQLMGHSSLNMTMDTYGHLWANPEVDNHIALMTERPFTIQKDSHEQNLYP